MTLSARQIVAVAAALSFSVLQRFFSGGPTAKHAPQRWLFSGAASVVLGSRRRGSFASSPVGALQRPWETRFDTARQLSTEGLCFLQGVSIGYFEEQRSGFGLLAFMDLGQHVEDLVGPASLLPGVWQDLICGRPKYPYCPQRPSGWDIASLGPVGLVRTSSQDKVDARYTGTRAETPFRPSLIAPMTLVIDLKDAAKTRNRR